MKHIEALWAVLSDLTGSDPFARVSPKYRVSLEDRRSALQVYMAQLAESERESLRQLLREFIAETLIETTIDGAAKMADVIGYRELDDHLLSDLAWFKEFPQCIPMACAVEAYHAIESLV